MTIRPPARSPGSRATPDGGTLHAQSRLRGAARSRETARLLSRLKSCKEGRALLAEKPVLDGETCDLPDLLRLPRGTFGREYAEWMRANGFDPGADDPPPDPTADPDARYVCERMARAHDLWHVLTGYNCDEDGERGLLAFSLGQTGSREIAAHLRAVVRDEIRFAWRTGDREWRHLLGYLWRGWRCGRRARLLAAVSLEDYFALPLDSVRQRLGIEPAAEAYSGHSLPPIAVPA